MQPVSTAKLDVLDAELIKWCSEWIRRRKVLHKLAHLFLLLSRLLKELSPPDAVQLAENLGIDYDMPEHLELESGSLCAPSANASKRR